MRWLLNLFPQYRELQALFRQEADRAMKLQDQVDLLLKQNVRLEEEASMSRMEEKLAIKGVANVGFQMSGGLPPYPEAYALPKRPPASDPGPVATGRIYARDAVRQGVEDFRSQLYGRDSQHETQEPN